MNEVHDPSGHKDPSSSTLNSSDFIDVIDFRPMRIKVNSWDRFGKIVGLSQELGDLCP